MSPEEQAAAAEQAHRRWTDRYTAERPDPAFAASAAGSLRRELGTLADKGGFRVVDVDCRTTMCLASVEWPSYALVADGANQIMAHPYAVNCAMETRFPPPDDPAKAYQASVYFDCEHYRAEMQ